MPQIPSPVTRRRARIEIIPLIDIMFFLLATFMMVSISMIQNDGVEVNLPGARSSEKVETSAQKVTVSVSGEGALFWGKELVNMEEISRRFVGVREKNPKTQVVIQTDRQAPAGKMIAVLDEARRLGLKKVLIRTKKEAGSL